jgi:hypothetical protein
MDHSLVVLAPMLKVATPLILSPIHCSSIRKVLIAAGRNRTKYRRSSSMESRIHQPKSLSWKEHGTDQPFEGIKQWSSKRLFP